jgi:hypothetical protein
MERHMQDRLNSIIYPGKSVHWGHLPTQVTTTQRNKYVNGR